ncbi:glutamate-5-semialdehyde dehydrogenase [Lactobacillus salivarius]|uniref:Gamma-glutamyl phosphate reductase n=2 Tax=Ligilactobacillus salivarius TaxID=1624 RepID=A0A2G4RHR1_9LACO|nr:glutamate-5-semialdehyde dehydrogenase [Ligilactobacillus salivarius]ATP35501.1 gamma-glutamyl-phosphate reductase [Ligilactobacillus salivarius]ATP37162.1 gamma-glutamyl-phosphate reductase [Ligilactobacillus salivarius]EEJ74357.1 glutamate-5-semialdehyde dehydrogenase [Ligilactobacillus salivarius DSM 20555 = ATCC 11741]KRM69198.1 glutamate-5-semialdehyde dehydrogenase [Ligilactobacillus salivarius DSM 20555 = ATCC 11741]MBE7938129.1 glutamate-5-semialdehyde dehydrogenase [Ligilactobacill
MTVDLNKMGQAAREASRQLALLGEQKKNQVLETVAQELLAKADEIIAANKVDLENATNMPEKFIDRLKIDNDRIAAMAEGVRQVAQLADPIGKIDAGWVNYAGLQIEKKRVPLGVVGMIFEARPNVTVDASALCFKSGNAVILRGGKEALQTNIKITKVIRQALEQEGINPDAVQVITETSHELANEFMQLTDYLDVLIPRGSARLIQTVLNTAKVPVIETGAGICHVYVDKFADKKMAVEITTNAKVQRPSVCNAIENLVIHQDVAQEYLPAIADELQKYNVELRGDEKVCEILGDKATLATAEDWDTEYNDYIIAIKIVSSIDEAIDFINEHNTKHSEAIITENYTRSQKFLNEIDAACVYVNASTRFTDGFEFGFGAEIGISTQKLHARGPMGLEALTSTKYVIRGNGQIRK